MPHFVNVLPFTFSEEIPDETWEAWRKDAERLAKRDGTCLEDAKLDRDHCATVLICQDGFLVLTPSVAPCPLGGRGHHCAIVVAYRWGSSSSSLESNWLALVKKFEKSGMMRCPIGPEFHEVAGGDVKFPTLNEAVLWVEWYGHRFVRAMAELNSLILEYKGLLGCPADGGRRRGQA